MPEPKSILITGASSGIGAALALTYAADGIRLALTGRNAGRLSETADACRAKGASVETACIDVSDSPTMAAWIGRIDAAAPLDLVIANAGLSGSSPADATLADTTAQIFNVNVTGTFNTIHPAIEYMRQRGGGQVAVMSSLAGFRGLPSAAAYSASKIAIRGYGEALRGLLFHDNIRVSVICPGYVRSRMTAGNEFPMPLLMDADKAAQIIRRGLSRNRARIAFPKRLFAIVWLLSALPPSLTDPLLRRLPAKR